MIFFAVSPKRFEQQLTLELEKLNAKNIKESIGGVYFEADLKTAYQITLGSRLANKILLILEQASVQSIEECYKVANKINWSQHFTSNSTFNVDFSGTNKFINNTQFGALKIKDAIVDHYKQQSGSRPNIEKTDPDFQINARIHKEKLTISINFSGNNLQQRHYRIDQGIAPIKENLGYLLLKLAKWEDKANIIDPFCGSGTLLIEAAMEFRNIPPAFNKTRFGFDSWLGHNQEMWNEVKEAATANINQETPAKKMFVGYDNNPKMIAIAIENAKQAGVDDLIHFERKQAQEIEPTAATGLVISNTPFGKRLGETNKLTHLFYEFGKNIKTKFAGWQISLLAHDINILSAIRLKYYKAHNLYNGALECQLCHYTIDENITDHPPLAEDFCNRIKKKQKQLKSWLQQTNQHCYRIYDADLPDYNVAIDIYNEYVVVQEYKAKDTVSPNKAAQRLTNIILVLPQLLKCEAENIIIKTRSIQKGNNQYQSQEEDLIIKIKEEEAEFKINLTKYLDTGVFLDHRLIRKYIAENAAGKSFLNLFAYTGTASVQAGINNAKLITTVDMSKTYIRWAQDNFHINNLVQPYQYQFVNKDCQTWLEHNQDQKYDLILLDPPTFSNSKKTDKVFDVTKDYLGLIELCKNILAPKGVLLFSTNKKNFKIDEQELTKINLIAENITHKTTSPDFKNSKTAHACWLIKHKEVTK